MVLDEEGWSMSRQVREDRKLGLSRRDFLAKVGLGGAALIGTQGLPVLLEACQGGAGPTGGGVASGNVKVVWTNVVLPQNLDPAIGFDSDTLQFVRNAYDTLLEYAPGETTLRPGLAESYTTATDGLSYTFKLRPNVLFHDGSKVDADAVVTSLRRIQEINQGPASYMINVKGFEAPDPQTVVVRMSAPYVFFPGAVPWFPIVSAEAIRAHRTASDPWAKNWFASNAAGSGPYMLRSFEPENRIDLVQNKHYWRPWRPGVPIAGSMTANPNVTTQLELLQRGETDFLGDVSPDNAATARTLSNVALIVQPGLAVKTLPINMQRSPTDNIKVRQAITAAFDYAAFLKFFKGFGQPANGPLPPNFPDWDSSIPNPTQDLKRARQLLAEAGYPNGGFTLEYVAVQGLDYEAYAGTLLQSALQQLGIKVQATAPPWPQIPPMMAKPASAPHISFLNFSANTNDPSNMIRGAYHSSQVASKGGYNWSYYVNPQVDRMLDEVISTPDASRQQQLMSQLQTTIVGAFPTVYAIAPQLTEPVRKEWSHVKYDALFDVNVIRWFFFAKHGS